MPERFELEYVGADNARHRPIMLHRALFGSVERFFGVLLEHYAGNLPTWLSPVQVRVLPVATAHEEYAEKVVDRLRAIGARVDLVGASEQLGKRIRAAKLEKLPYILVVGDDDVANTHRRRQPAGERPARARRRPGPLRRAAGRGDRARHDAPRAAGLSERRDAVLERLWNGWRAAYVTSGGAAGGVSSDDVDSGRGSVFTRILHSGLPDVDTHIVHRGEHVFAILNAFPYAVGHTLVLPYREVADLEALTPTRPPSCGRRSPTPCGRSRRPTARRASTSASTSASRPAAASATTSTSTSCPAGPATATS